MGQEVRVVIIRFVRDRGGCVLDEKGLEFYFRVLLFLKVEGVDYFGFVSFELFFREGKLEQSSGGGLGLNV